MKILIYSTIKVLRYILAHCFRYSPTKEPCDPSPAAQVPYITSNNLFHILKQRTRRQRQVNLLIRLQTCDVKFHSLSKKIEAAKNTYINNVV